MKKIVFCSLLGLVASFNLTAATINYSYDHLGRVVKVQYSNGKSITYKYDTVGNRTAVESVG